jgi:hypothetical protein
MALKKVAFEHRVLLQTTPLIYPVFQRESYRNEKRNSHNDCLLISQGESERLPMAVPFVTLNDIDLF